MELIARVKSQLRRYVTLGVYKEIEKVINLNGLTLDESAKEVTVDGEFVKLTPTEYKIVELLMKNAGRVFSINEIYERVWKEPCFNAENTVAVHIRKIREKIEINPKQPRYLKVVWGIGYKIEK
ncbi:Sensory transduction protein regX3 [compost metagenome]